MSKYTSYLESYADQWEPESYSFSNDRPDDGLSFMERMAAEERQRRQGPSSVAVEEERGITGVAGDLGLSVMRGFTGLAGSIGWLGEKLTPFDAPFEWLQDQSRRSEEITTGWQSEESRQVQSEGVFSSVEAFSHAVAESVPSFIASMGLGGVATKAIGAGIAKALPQVGSYANLVKFARAGDPRAAGILTKVNKAKDIASGAIGFGGSEVALAAGMAGYEMENIVLGMGHDELYEGSDRYRQIYDAAVDMAEPDRVDYAKAVLGDEAGTEVARNAAIGTALPSLIAGGVFGRMPGLAQAKEALGQSSRLASAGVGAATEATQEFFQSGGEQFAQNLGIRKYLDPEKNVTEGVLDAALAGGAVGGVLGGGFGATVYQKADSPNQKESEANATPEQIQALQGAFQRFAEAGVDQTSARQLLRWRVVEDVSLPEFVGAARELAETGTLPERVREITAGDFTEDGELSEAAFINDGWLEDSVVAQVKTDDPRAVLDNLFQSGVTPYQLDNGRVVVPARDEKALRTAMKESGVPFEIVSPRRAQSGIEIVPRGTIVDSSANTDQAQRAIDAAANEAATSPENAYAEPTQAQKAAGNYRKGRVKLAGLNVSIENPRGSVRKGKGWSRKMKHHYGYITGAQDGADGDKVDVFLGPEAHRDDLPVFVVNQRNKTGAFDEHKVMLGFKSEGEARNAYLSEYPAGWKGLDSVAQMSNAEFKQWVREGDTRQAVNPLSREPMKLAGDRPVFEGLTPEDRAEIELSAAIEKQTAGVSPRVRALIEKGIRETQKPLGRDPVFGYHLAGEREPTVKRAQEIARETGQPAAYVEADVQNLGGLNARLGHSGADKVLKEVGTAVREAIEGTNAAVVPVRHGGDEVSFVVVGADTETVKKAAKAAEAAVQEIAEREGLEDLPHPKGGSGFGLIAEVAEINPDATLEDIYSDADLRVEERKNVQRGQTETTGDRPGPAAVEDQRAAEAEAEGAGPEASAERDAETAEESPRFSLRDEIDEKAETRAETIRKRKAPAFTKVKAHIESIQNSWTAGKAKVVERQSDLPQGLQEKYRDMGLEGQPIEGVYWNGRAYIVAENVKSLKHAEKVLIEEVLRHQGLRRVFGAQLDEWLDQVWASVSGNVGDLLQTYRHLNVMTTEGQRAAAEEYIAKFGLEQPTLWEMFKARVRRWMRDHGFTLKVTDAEIRDILDVVQSRTRSGLAMPRGDLPGTEVHINSDGELVRAYLMSDGTDALETVHDDLDSNGDHRITVRFGSGEVEYRLRGVVGEGGTYQRALMVEKADKGTAGHILEYAGSMGFSHVLMDGGVEQVQVLTDDGTEARAAFTVEEPRFSLSPTDSEEFRNWFGASKVVDASGKPLVMYHGTRENITEFRTEGSLGAHFGSRDAAMDRLNDTREQFQRWNRSQSEGAKEVVMPVYLSIRNPIRLPDAGAWHDPLAVVAALKKAKVLPQMGLGDFADVKRARRRAGDTRSDEYLDSPEVHDAMEDVRSALERQGYDGIVYENSTEDAGQDSYIAFRPEQIKSATGNRGTFDPNNPDIRFSLAPAFYSQLTDVATQKLPGKGPADQIAQMLQSWQRKGEVKAEELEWSGVLEWLREQQGTVTKDQVMDFLRANEVQVREVEYGAGHQPRRATAHEIERAREWIANIDDHATAMEAYSALEAAIHGEREALGDLEGMGMPDRLVAPLRDAAAGDTSRYAEYQTPGGENYRELLLALPSSGEGAALKRGLEIKQDADGKWNVWDATADQGRGDWVWHEGKPAREAAVAAAMSDNMLADASKAVDYHSGHWDETNVLAHVRFNERTDADGNRVLFIEEVQSDWHQAGRKKGYRPAANERREIDAMQRRIGDVGGLQNLPEPEQDRARELGARLVSDGVPDAPFKKTWPLLAMKRMIRYAAENGFDRIAWLPGQMQADRYDLSKQVDSLLYKANEDGTYRVSAQVGGRGHMLGESLAEGQLEDHVGKEVAERIIGGEGESLNLGANNEPRDMWQSLSGDGLKVGGEGMIGFYDKILPATVNKYVKKWGAKVGQATFNAEDAEIDIMSGEDTADGGSLTAHTIDITPEMRESALAGQPMFSLTGAIGEDGLDQTIDRVIKPTISTGGLWGKAQEMMSGLLQFSRDDVMWHVRQQLFDEGAPIQRLEMQVFGKVLDAKDSAYKMYGLSKNLPGVMQAVFKHGVPVYRDGVFQLVDGRKGLLEVFEPLFENEGRLREWEAYAVARRSQRLIREGREARLTRDEIDDLLQLDTKYNGLFERIFQDWQEINRQALDLAVDRGALAPEMAEKWLTNDYVPFYRAEEDLENSRIGGRMMAKRGLDGQSVTSRRLKGADARVDHVFENMVLNTAKILDKVYRNETMRRIVGLADGVAMEKVPQAMRPIRLSNREIARSLARAGLVVAKPPEAVVRQGSKAVEQYMESEGMAMVEAMDEAELDEWQAFFRPVAPQGPDIVSVMENGKPVYYRVMDPALLQAIQGLDPTMLKGIMGKVFRGPKQMLTELVTADPGFMLANFIRDFGSTFIAVDAYQEPLSALGAAISSTRDILQDEGVVAQMQAAGGAMSGFYDPTGNIGKQVERQTKQGWTVLNSPLRLYEAWRKVGQVSEQANRAAVAKAVLARGGSVAEAAWQAQDVLNFTQHGASIFMRTIIEMVPFFNARLQGLYKIFFRAATGETAIGSPEAAKRAFWMKGIALWLLTWGLYALHYREEEEYERVPDFDKDSNWHFWIGGKHYVLPKPFELGLLFSTVPERMARVMDDRQSGADFAQDMVRNVLETLAFNPTPQAVKPLMESVMNHNTFTGNPVVNLSLQGLSPEAQYHPWTSETMRAIANVNATVLPEFLQAILPDFMQSPVHMQHVFRGYTGTIGSYLLSMSDAMVRDMTGLPDAPSGPITGLPSPLSDMTDRVIGRVFRGDEDLEGRNRFSELLYQELDKANSAYRALNKYKREGQVDQMQRIMKSRGNYLAFRAYMNDVATDLRELNSMEREIRYSQALTPQEKRERLNRLIEARNQLLEQAAPIIQKL